MKNQKILNNIAKTSVAMLLTTGFLTTNSASAQTAASSSSSGAVGQKFANVGNGTGANGPLLANAVAGKLLLKADVGYVYSFAGDWNKSNAELPSIGGNTSTATGGVGYGVSLGWTSKTGFGLSADYLGFNHKWTGLGTDGQGTEYNYDAPYHVMTITPSYRFKLDQADNWGLRVGLGVGFSLSDVNWAQKLPVGGAQSKAGTKVTGGASYVPDANTGIARTTGGSVLCPDNDTATVFDSVGNIVYTSQCASGSGARLSTTSDYAIATWLQGLGISQSDLEAIANTPGNGGLIKSTGSINYTGTIASSVINSCVWGIVLNCFKADGTQADAAYVSAAQAQAAAAAAAKLAQDTADCLAKGAGYNYANGVCNAPSADSSGGSAKDDAGFVLAPQVALEYDNNLLHFDINVKYIHELFNVRYFGSEGSVSGTATSGAITYTRMAGPLALFIGAGLGVNF